MAPSPFLLYNPHSTRRETELLHAQAKSLAAAVSHKRRRARKAQQKSTTLVVRSTSFPLEASLPTPVPNDQDHYEESSIALFDPWQLSNGYRNDPFNIVPGTNGGVAALALDYLTGYLFPSADAISSAYGTSNWWRKLVIAMSQSGEVLDAVTCVLAATRDMVVRDSTPQGFQNLSPEILHHRGQAISRLRQRFLDPGAVADDCAILAVLFLSIFDQGVGDKEAALIHWKQLGQMIQVRGGPGGISSELGLRDILVQFQQLSGSNLENFPPDESIEPLALCPQEYQKNVDGCLYREPISFQHLFLHGSLSRSSMKVVVRMAKIQRQHEGQCSSKGVLREDPSLFVPEDSSLLARLVALALLRYRVNSNTRLRHFVCPYEQAAWTLSVVLPRVDVPTNILERQTLFWVWLVAIDAWSVSTTLKSHLTTTGLKLFSQLVGKFPEIRTWEICDIQAVGNKFFWYKTAPKWLGPAWETMRGPLE